MMKAGTAGIDWGWFMQGQQQPQQENLAGQHDILARQKRFALVLSGDERQARLLVERLQQAQDVAGRKGLSSSALHFFQFRKLYELWVGETGGKPRSNGIFEPGRENDAIQKGLDPSIARVMGGQPFVQRIVLLLIYGENFSYAATAQLLDISTKELVTILARARQGFLTRARDSLPPFAREEQPLQGRREIWEGQGSDTA